MHVVDLRGSTSRSVVNRTTYIWIDYLYMKIILVRNVIGRALEVEERENIENG
jgi:hypothetical protein